MICCHHAQLRKYKIGIDFTTAFQLWDLNFYKLQYTYNVRDIECILYLMTANHV